MLLVKCLMWVLITIAWQIFGSAVNYSQPKGNICSYGNLNSFIIFCVFSNCLIVLFLSCKANSMVPVDLFSRAQKKEGPAPKVLSRIGVPDKVAKLVPHNVSIHVGDRWPSRHSLAVLQTIGHVKTIISLTDRSFDTLVYEIEIIRERTG